MTQISPSVERNTKPEPVEKYQICIDELQKMLVYDPLSGAIRWRIGKFKGKIAGTRDRFGYLRICINYKQLQASHICWAMSFGEWPSSEIDHINRIKDDNRISNLRLSSRSNNLKNRSGYGVSGFKGVYASGKKFRARIRMDGKSIDLGSFSSPLDASKAYVAAGGVI